MGVLWEFMLQKWIQLGEYVNSWIKGHAGGEMSVYTAVTRGLGVHGRRHYGLQKGLG